MNIVLFYHSLLSDWNHGNAHFLRGIATELVIRGHEVQVYEPHNGWSFTNMIKDGGLKTTEEFSAYYPLIKSRKYDPENPDLEEKLEKADLVIVHEWNDHSLVKEIGALKNRFGFSLFFHDTHHRSVTEREQMNAYDLSGYDAVLAYGEVIKNIYMKHGWARKVYIWHEAADTRVFIPMQKQKAGDLVWIGNWGDEERTEELHEFLINPVKQLGLKATVYGVRYPPEGIRALKDAGIAYGGWLPNYKVPEIFASYRFTIHVPRRPYTRQLKGIPTIRPFEALACGIPLISAPWEDAEGLFRERDYLKAANGEEMVEQMRRLMNEENLCHELAANGLETILERHTCTHRVDELLHFYSLHQPDGAHHTTYTT